MLSTCLPKKCPWFLKRHPLEHLFSFFSDFSVAQMFTPSCREAAPLGCVPDTKDPS